jgi:hypothetical protein
MIDNTQGKQNKSAVHRIVDVELNIGWRRDGP